MGAQVTPAWRLTWEEPWTLDKVAHISMVPRVSLGYVAWCIRFCTRYIRMDDKEDKVSNEISLEDDPYQVNNPIHDIPIQEGEVSGTLGLAILAVAAPLTTPVKRPYQVFKIFNFNSNKNA